MTMNKADQSMKPKRSGETLSAAAINQLIAKIKSAIVGGKGILVRRSGDQVIIEAERQQRGGGGTSNGVKVYLRSSKAALPDAGTVAEGSFGRITSGVDDGMLCIVNPTQTGWDALNVCE